MLRENSWREGHSFSDLLGSTMITQVLYRLDVTKFEFYLRLNKDFPETWGYKGHALECKGQVKLQFDDIFIFSP